MVSTATRERFQSEVKYKCLGAVLQYSIGRRLDLPLLVCAMHPITLTGCRKSESLTLRSEHIELKVERWICRTRRRASRSGARRSCHRGAPRQDDGPWVIAGHKHVVPLHDLQICWLRIRKRVSLDGSRHHEPHHAYAGGGLRHTPGKAGHRRAVGKQAGRQGRVRAR